MKNLHKKIEDRKQAIQDKKLHLVQDYKTAEGKISTGRGLTFTSIAGFAIGFLLLPKKFKILKTVFKAYSMAATVRGFMDLLPRHGNKPKQIHRRKH